MKEFIGQLPAEGTPEYAELVRRQTAVGIPATTPASTRGTLLKDEGLGRFYIPDRKPVAARPRKATPRGQTPIEPSITVTQITAGRKPRRRWYKFWESK